MARSLAPARLRRWGATSATAVSLPVPAASPSTDREKAYAVQTQMLTQTMTQQLTAVEQRQRDLNVRLDLRATQSGLDEYKQVKQAGATRSKS